MEQTMRKRNKLKSSVGTLVLRIVLGSLAVVAGTGMVNGNPIAVTPGFELSTENVTVNVYQSESRITGDYTFRRIAQPRSDPENAEYDGSGAGTNGLRGRWRSPRSVVVNYGISLAVPIILPTNGVTIQKELAQPVQLREKYLTDSIQER